MKQVNAIIDSARPRQWLKNLLLFVPIVFGGQLFDYWSFSSVTFGFLAFCLLSSSDYIINDIIDVEQDRRHPFKKQRPVARRDLPEIQAWITAILFLILGLAISYTLGVSFFMSACVFVLLHWLLYFFLRNISVIDVLAIASGYVLRVFAGQAAVGLHISVSVWLFLSVLSFSLLLALGKRRAELSFLQQHDKNKPVDGGLEQFKYSEKLLDAYVAVFGNATFLTYAYYTFLATPEAVGLFTRGGDMSLGWLGRKLLMFTIPPALYCIMRYLQIVYSVKVGVLEKIVTGDKPLAIAVLIWTATVIVVVYGIGR